MIALSIGGWIQSIYVLTCAVILISVTVWRIDNAVKRRWHRDDEHPLYMSGETRRHRNGNG